MSHRALKSVQSFFSVENGKKEKGKAQKVTQALYFTYLWGSPP